ncbi:hypothetical protein ABW286_08940 [Erwinia papayae]|uniref:Uncharacterized protein n=1 Tax=Erwinia papayae TaxID=206499 RepID=A0ABV3N0G1_9GAMM
MKKLSDAGLVNFVKKNLKISISETNAAVLRTNIQQLNSAIKVMNNEVDSRVFIELRNNDEALASYSSGEGFIIIDEFLFSQPVPETIITLLHESSHATGMVDFMYLKNMIASSEDNSYKPVETYKELRQYTTLLTRNMGEEGVLIQVENVMNDLRKNLTKSQMEKYLKLKYLKISKYKLPSDLESGFVNSPDTIALTTLFLSGETKTHFFKKNILNLKDVSGLVSDSYMARDFSKDLKARKITGLK